MSEPLVLSHSAEDLTCYVFPPAAGNAFCKAARLQLQVDSKLNAAVNFIDAGNAFKKSDPEGRLPQFIFPQVLSNSI